MSYELDKVNGRKQDTKALLSYILIMFLGSLIVVPLFIMMFSNAHNVESDVLLASITTPSDDEFINQLVSQIMSYTNVTVFALLLIVIGYFMFGYLKQDAMKIKDEKSKTLIFTITSFFIMFLTTAVVSIIVNSLIENSQSVNQDSVSSIVKNNPLLAFFMVVICAPIVEELVFRKAIFNKLSAKSALVVSTLVFTIMHMFGDNGDLVQTLLISLLYLTPAVLFGLFYIKSDKNIYPVIGIHLLNNLLAFSVLLL